jgi:uncharacterized heparinase superfamily protein
VFLSQDGDLQQVGWDGPEREVLWRYNQHYFDDLNAAEASRRAVWHRRLVHDWIRGNPPGQGIGWEPYPTSLRIVNWIKWFLSGNDLPAPCAHSLAVQARWLCRRLEYHLLGNHLLSNAKALVFAGLYFDGAEAHRWRQKGFRILSREMREQVLLDGGHFELSPMYHALALEDTLDLLNLADSFVTALDSEEMNVVLELRDKASAMLHWLRAMCHPDGSISFFNDAAADIGPSLSELEAYADRLGVRGDCVKQPITWLDDSGYARLEVPGAVALLDMAPIGPDYLPGHAHADTLSFELSVRGRRTIVNSGTSCYGISIERLRQRGTAAHNTVVVSGEDSSEVWGGFRVARRARPIGPEITVGQELVASCGHDGYTRLPGSPVHKRRWIINEGRISVRDHVSTVALSSEARFHFHPDVKVSIGPRLNQGFVLLADGHKATWCVDHGDVRIERTSWHPGFGSSLENQCLVIELVEGRSSFSLQW